MLVDEASINTGSHIIEAIVFVKNYKIVKAEASSVYSLFHIFYELNLLSYTQQKRKRFLNSNSQNNMKLAWQCYDGKNKSTNIFKTDYPD